MNEGILQFLYWNTENKDSKDDILNDLLEKNSIDVIMLGECGRPLSAILCNKYNLTELQLFSGEGERLTQRVYHNKLKNVSFKHINNIPEDEKEEVLFSKTLDGELILRRLKRLNRASMIETTYNNEKFLLVLVHLPSKKNLDESSQLQAAINYKRLIAEVASLYENKVIITGDFNMNPFDLGMVEPLGFFAINYKKRVQEESKFQHFSQLMFYNPCWGLLGDYDKINEISIVSGSHFYKNSPSKKLFWHLFDQVIVSKKMITNFVEGRLEVVQVQEIINEVQSALTRDKANYSDHLPITFILKFENDVKTETAAKAR
jgi:exonuclease III